MYWALATLFFCDGMSPQRNVVAARPSGQDVSLVEILDHVLHSGVVVQGSVVISLAGVDLIYLGLSAVVTSVETALRQVPQPPR
jgi:hypothetical protein